MQEDIQTNTCLENMTNTKDYALMCFLYVTVHHEPPVIMVRKNGEFGKLIPEKYWYVEGNFGILGKILPFCT